MLINRYPHGDRVVKCVSHAFTEAESRWKTLEQEAFAVVFTLLHFRNVLWGHYFLVETDHRNLTFIHSGTSAKVIRWSLAVQQFCFAISFIPGEQNVVADTLSCAPGTAKCASSSRNGLCWSCDEDSRSSQGPAGSWCVGREKL